MKNIFTTSFIITVFFCATITVQAQDSSNVKKQIGASNEKADNINGKKIQQQTLSSGKFEQLDTTVLPKSIGKQKKKSKRKH